MLGIKFVRFVSRSLTFWGNGRLYDRKIDGTCMFYQASPGFQKHIRLTASLELFLVNIFNTSRTPPPINTFAGHAVIFWSQPCAMTSAIPSTSRQTQSPWAIPSSPSDHIGPDRSFWHNRNRTPQAVFKDCIQKRLF